MPEINPSSILPNLLIGVLIIVVGALTIRFRERYSRATIALEKSMFGKAGRALAEHQSSVGMVIAGCGGIAMGCFLVGLAVAAIVQLLT